MPHGEGHSLAARQSLQCEVTDSVPYGEGHNLTTSAALVLHSLNTSKSRPWDGDDAMMACIGLCVLLLIVSRDVKGKSERSATTDALPGQCSPGALSINLRGACPVLPLVPGNWLQIFQPVLPVTQPEPDASPGSDDEEDSMHEWQCSEAEFKHFMTLRVRQGGYIPARAYWCERVDGHTPEEYWEHTYDDSVLRGEDGSELQIDWETFRRMHTDPAELHLLVD